MAILWGGLAVAGVVLGARWVQRRLVVVTVTGASMLPAFRNGDQVVVRRGAMGAVRVGQVVVLRRPEAAAGPAAGLFSTSGSGPRLAGGDWMIKRVVAVAGDALPAELNPATTRSRTPGLDGTEAARVPDQRIVVLGDNRAVSHDSRHFGLVRASDLLGVVIWRLPAAELHR